MLSLSLELLTFSVASCTFGFLCPIRRFKDLMASLGCTLFERITSEISRFKAMSSLEISISFDGTFISSAFRIKGPGPGRTSLKTSPFRSAHREPSWMQTSQPSSQSLLKASCLARRCGRPGRPSYVLHGDFGGLFRRSAEGGEDREAGVVEKEQSICSFEVLPYTTCYLSLVCVRLPSGV